MKRKDKYSPIKKYKKSKFHHCEYGNSFAWHCDIWSQTMVQHEEKEKHTSKQYYSKLPHYQDQVEQPE